MCYLSPVGIEGLQNMEGEQMVMVQQVDQHGNMVQQQQQVTVGQVSRFHPVGVVLSMNIFMILHTSFQLTYL